MSKMKIVTVKLPRNPSHDPQNKITGPCPVSGLECTDVTGAHHTLLTTTDSEFFAITATHHITRVESV